MSDPIIPEAKEAAVIINKSDSAVNVIGECTEIISAACLAYHARISANENRYHRWNIEERGESLFICKNEHEKSQPCEPIEYVPARMSAEKDAEIRVLKQDNEAHVARCYQAEAGAAALREALEFYANPENYFAIGFLVDRPCGDFATDFEPFDFEMQPCSKDDPTRRDRPGKTARAALSSPTGQGFVRREEISNELRAWAGGTKPVPESLRHFAFSQMVALANYIDGKTESLLAAARAELDKRP